MKIVALIIVILFTVGCGEKEIVSNQVPKCDEVDITGIDFSNIENLYEQPLCVIQKCVQGKWKVIALFENGANSATDPKNAFIDIKEDSVIITKDENDWLWFYGNQCPSFTYSWENKKVTSIMGQRPEKYMTYVMQNDCYRMDIGTGTDVKLEGWYFDSIKNDTLYMIADIDNTLYSYTEIFLMLRIE